MVFGACRASSSLVAPAAPVSFTCRAANLRLPWPKFACLQTCDAVLNTLYVQCPLEPFVQRTASEFPAVILTGPRQSRKTTVLQSLFGSSCRYVSLEPPDVRLTAMADPRGFLEMCPSPVILEEVQNAPDLLPYIKEKIDVNRRASGQYLLSGSQNLSLSEHVSESLAGRAAMLRLLPLSRREADGQPEDALVWERKVRPSCGSPHVFNGLWRQFLRGGYPELATQPDRDASLWHASYIQAYLERDVRTLRQLGDLTQHQNSLRVLAARSAQLLNLTDVARDLGVAVTTVKAWLSVLEATYQVIVLRPYFANVGKRLVKILEYISRMSARSAAWWDSRTPNTPPKAPWAAPSWKRRCWLKSSVQWRIAGWTRRSAVGGRRRIRRWTSWSIPPTGPSLLK